MKRLRKFKMVFLAMLCVLCVTGFSGNAIYSNAKKESKTATEQQFEIEVTSGFQNTARVGRHMVAKVTVKNQGEDFSGALEVILPISEGDNVMYESDLSIAAGEEKTISVPMYINAYTRKLVVRITDEEEKVLVKKRAKINLLTSNDNTRIVGILTDEKDTLGYWEEDTNKDANKVIYFSQEDMPEIKEGLDALDILIINDFDTKNLSDKQYQTLKQWVNKGGNLVIGTGVNVNRTLGAFQDKFLTGSIGEVGKDGVANLSFDGGEVFTDKKDTVTMFRVKKKLGCICVFTTDMGVDYANWKEKGSTYKKIVNAHIEKEYQGNNDSYYDGNGYSTSYGADYTDKGKLPSVKKYAIVLMIYVVVVSWILYFILHKKDKLEWTWVCVPALALIFAVIIYGMGAVTRITEPFITYVRTIEWEGEGEDSGVANTRMSITSPYNEKYSVAVPKDTTAYAANNWGDWYEENETDFDSYKLGFGQSKGQQIVTLNNFGAFESARLTTDDVATMKGSYESDIVCDQYEFKGTFTNRTGREIRNAIFVSDGRIYYLGDIKNGEKVNISNKHKNMVCLSAYSIDVSIMDEEYNEIFGFPSDRARNLEEKRYEAALAKWLTSKKSALMDGNVIGIMDSDGVDEQMSKNWGIDCSGITMGVFPVNVNYTNKAGEQFVSDLYYYSSVTGDVTEQERAFYNKEVTMEYTLKQNETLTGLYYLAEVNSALSRGKKTGNGNPLYAYTCNSDFEGEIQAYNYKTKKYEKIFDGDKAGKVTDVKQFVGEDNTVLVKYKAKGNYDGWDIPVISATKEVK